MAAVRLILLIFLSLFISLTPCLSISENEALLKLKKSLTHVDRLDSWVPSTSPCKDRWKGIVCFDGIITDLRLSGLGLSGTIDVEALREIHGLRTISFINNSFTGPIPELNKLGSLKALFLSRNNFSGEIPNDYFSHMGSLKKVWLSSNQFSGTIPESIGQLPNLIELHLEGNFFSGSIPSMKQTKLASLDLSDNKLEGQIPESLSKFSASSFRGNEGLCGKPLDRTCTQKLEPPSSPVSAAAATPIQTQQSWSSIKVLMVVGLVILVVFFIVLAVSSKKRRDDDFSVLGKEHFDEVVEVHVANTSTSRRPSESNRKGDSSTRRGGGSNRNGMGDLAMVNDEKGTFGLADLMKASAEVLGNGGLGSAYKAVMSNGLSVVVKRMREMNKLGKDGFDAEMRRFGSFRHQNILTPLAYHYRKEEKLVVSEYIPKGSLLYVLHGDRGICHAELNWPTRLKIIHGIAKGMGFLHSEFASLDLPHGNLKSSNVLLTDTHVPLLTDYAFHPLINPSQASQAMFAYKSPEAVQNQQVSPKSDVYCLGIIILEILTGKFPSQYLSTGKGGIDVVELVHSMITEKKEAELIDPEIASSSPDSIDQMVRLLQIGAACTESDPQQRLDMGEANRRIEEVQI